MTDKKYCTVCGTVDFPIKQYKGSFLGELAFLIILIIIGTYTTYWIVITAFIYSTYRAQNKNQVCPKCKSAQIIPLDSPAAKAANTVKIQPD